MKAVLQARIIQEILHDGCSVMAITRTHSLHQGLLGCLGAMLAQRLNTDNIPLGACYLEGSSLQAVSRIHLHERILFLH